MGGRCGIYGEYGGIDRPLAGQVTVLDAMGLIGGCPETRSAVRLVVGIVTFEPNHAALAFEGENVCCDPIEKPSVMADHYSAACEVIQSFLKSP